MAKTRNFSDEEVIGIFEKLGLDQKSPAPKYSRPDITTPPLPFKNILVPRLSDSSVPPPTGRIADANLERSSK